MTAKSHVTCKLQLYSAMLSCKVVYYLDCDTASLLQPHGTPESECTAIALPAARLHPQWDAGMATPKHTPEGRGSREVLY